MPIDFTLPPELEDLRRRVRAFVHDEVLPMEADALDDDGALRPDALEAARKRGRAAGLWTPHLPPEWGGLGLGAVGMAVVSEELGYSPLAPLAVNCMAPDEGNMHTLLEFGTEAHKEKYLKPLADGRVRSCFAMTEPGGAGADATMVETTAERDGDAWVINGHKWFATGADGAAFAIVMAVTDPDAPRHSGVSLFIVDTDNPGWKLQRNVPTMGTHLPGGHGEIVLDDCRVPADAMLGGEGFGFAIGQARLGLGRIGHACRWIGTAQRALDLAAARAGGRETFGRLLEKRQAVQWMLADSANDLYTSRLQVLHAAWKIDKDLDYRREVSVLKKQVANALHRVIDRAIQVHGGQGVSHDTPLARFYMDARSARIYDGPDEVHQYVVAREVLRAIKRDGTTRRAAEVIPDAGAAGGDGR